MKKFISYLTTIILTAVIVGSGVYWWQNRLITNLKEEIREFETWDSKEALTDPSIYKNDKYGFQFKLPDNFFLLDRLNEQNEILINNEKIEFNDHLNGWYAPIAISPIDNADYLFETGGEKIIVDKKEGKIFKEFVPSDGVMNEYDVTKVVFKNPGILIEGKGGYWASFDSEEITRQIALSFKFGK